MLPCRILPFESDDGPGNMALDEALLASSAEGGGAALRIYGWSTPTLSLGYFQTITRAEAEPRWRDVPIVRRPTGGGALWHDRELTYCLILPTGHPLSRRSPDLYRAVHAAIAGLLNESGLDARRRGEPELGAEAATKPLLCFLDRDPEDVVLGDAKLVGSAQRRRAGAVLQHGSLLLARSCRSPELPGVLDFSDAGQDSTGWADRLIAAIPAALDLEPVLGIVSPEERACAARLATEIYRNPTWTRKR
jgi:lipoate-protein ligase A